MVRPNSGLLAAMLRGNLLKGALRWKVTFTEEMVAQEAAMAGWSSAWLDLTGLKTLDLVTREFGRVLNFPDFFDGELSSIGGLLGEQVPVDSGLVIAVTGWQDFSKANPGDASSFAETLDSALDGLNAVVIFSDPSGKYSGLAELSMA